MNENLNIEFEFLKKEFLQAYGRVNNPKYLKDRAYKLLEKNSRKLISYCVENHIDFVQLMYNISNGL